MRLGYVITEKLITQWGRVRGQGGSWDKRPMEATCTNSFAALSEQSVPEPVPNAKMSRIASMIRVPGDVTLHLKRLAQGEREAVEQILPLVYDELRALAARRLRGEHDSVMQPTALVHEAWLRLGQKSPPKWNDRAHFLRAAGAVMRWILVDHVRQRRQLKRGGKSITVPLDASDLAYYEDQTIDLIALDDALRKLEDLAPQQADIIELRFFAGLTEKETAELLGVSERTVRADWRLARAWLLREIESR